MALQSAAFGDDSLATLRTELQLAHCLAALDRRDQATALAASTAKRLAASFADAPQCAEARELLEALRR